MTETRPLRPYRAGAFACAHVAFCRARRERSRLLCANLRGHVGRLKLPAAAARPGSRRMGAQLIDMAVRTHTARFMLQSSSPYSAHNSYMVYVSALFCIIQYMYKPSPARKPTTCGGHGFANRLARGHYRPLTKHASALSAEQACSSNRQNVQAKAERRLYQAGFAATPIRCFQNQFGI